MVDQWWNKGLLTIIDYDLPLSIHHQLIYLILFTIINHLLSTEPLLTIYYLLNPPYTWFNTWFLTSNPTMRWLHDLGVAHRDLSLENILLTEASGAGLAGDPPTQCGILGESVLQHWNFFLVNNTEPYIELYIYIYYRTKCHCVSSTFVYEVWFNIMLSHGLQTLRLTPPWAESSQPPGSQQVKLIDFGMCTVNRRDVCRRCVSNGELFGRMLQESTRRSFAVHEYITNTHA